MRKIKQIARRCWWRLIFWMDEVLPQQCTRCKRWVQKGTMKNAPHRIAGWSYVCQECYRELYPDERIV
jgi:hypothetical protein